MRLKGFPDCFFITRNFQCFQSCIADIHEFSPLTQNRCLVFTDAAFRQFSQLGVLFLFLQETPDFFCCVWDDRCQKFSQLNQYFVKYGLHGASFQIILFFDVDNIFRKIKIECRQINCTEVHDCLIDGRELVLLISCHTCFNHLIQARHQVLIDTAQLFVGYGMFLRLEIFRIPDQETHGVADFAVSFRNLLQNIVTDSHIGFVIDTGHP